jgi:hypothetical protein
MAGETGGSQTQGHLIEPSIRSASTPSTAAKPRDSVLHELLRCRQLLVFGESLICETNEGVTRRSEP